MVNSPGRQALKSKQLLFIEELRTGYFLRDAPPVDGESTISSIIESKLIVNRFACRSTICFNITFAGLNWA